MCIQTRRVNNLAKSQSNARRKVNAHLPAKVASKRRQTQAKPTPGYLPEHQSNALAIYCIYRVLCYAKKQTQSDERKNSSKQIIHPPYSFPCFWQSSSPVGANAI
jgi:hypothetical protein